MNSMKRMKRMLYLLIGVLVMVLMMGMVGKLQVKMNRNQKAHVEQLEKSYE